MITFAGSIDIAQSRSRVFAFVSDLDNLPKIQSDVVQSTVLDPGTVHAGTRFEEVVKIGPRRVTARCVVTEYEPESRMAFQGESKVVNYESRFLVEPAGEGSRVTIEGMAELRGVWRLMQPLLAADVRKGVKHELSAIKRHTEAVTATSA
jgi:dehydrogenase/reductase SDR family protein 12